MLCVLWNSELGAGGYDVSAQAIVSDGDIRKRSRRAGDHVWLFAIWGAGEPFLVPKCIFQRVSVAPCYGLEAMVCRQFIPEQKGEDGLRTGLECQE